MSAGYSVCNDPGGNEQIASAQCKVVNCDPVLVGGKSWGNLNTRNMEKANHNPSPYRNTEKAELGLAYTRICFTPAAVVTGSTSSAQQEPRASSAVGTSSASGASSSVAAAGPVVPAAAPAAPAKAARLLPWLLWGRWRPGESIVVPAGGGPYHSLAQSTRNVRILTFGVQNLQAVCKQQYNVDATALAFDVAKMGRGGGRFSRN